MIRIGHILGLYRENAKENGKYYIRIGYTLINNVLAFGLNLTRTICPSLAPFEQLSILPTELNGRRFLSRNYIRDYTKLNHKRETFVHR